MKSPKQVSGHSKILLWLSVASLFLFSAAFRVWGLSRFNTLVFDEVYFAKYASYYLTHTPFFDVHPPLGKYLIAIGIWLGQFNPLGLSTQTVLPDFQLPTLSYRWLNALVGSFIPLLVAAIAYGLSRRYRFALIAGLFVAADGYLLVESRYALINVYLVLFGLMGSWFLLLALRTPKKLNTLWLIASGLSFGASASVKWSGLWFLLGIYVVWSVAWILRRLGLIEPPVQKQSTPLSIDMPESSRAMPGGQPLSNLAELNPIALILNFAVLPFLVYALVWIPHLRLNPTPGFWGLQKQILAYHQQVGSGPTEHPYCSSWLSWPLMVRPVAYFYQETEPGQVSSVIYDVHGIGNPILWWLGTIAIFVLLLALVWYLIAWAQLCFTSHPSNRLAQLRGSSFWIVLFIGANFLANWLPWARVTRCAFLYHYMGASIFSFMAIAWLSDQLLQSKQTGSRLLGGAIILGVLAGFFFWLPIYLGLPLSPEGFQSRMWLRSWY